MRSFKKKSLVVLMTLAGSASQVNLASAHAYLLDPPSRGYLCKTDNSAGCQALRSSNQMEAINTPQQNVYVGSDYLDYTRSLPDGHICRANRSNDRLDLPNTSWTSTAVTPNTSGEITLKYFFTTHHTTDHIRYYITKQGTDNTKAIKWSDLTEIGHYPAVPSPTGKPGGSGSWIEKVRLPAGTSGKHTIVSMWPVARGHGSQENFVSCSDVDIQGSTTTPEEGWAVIGNGVRAGQDLKTGDSVVFRLFADGAVAATVQHVISEAELGTAANWLYDLAKKVNNQGIAVKVGDTLSNGVVSLTAVKDNYNVYAVDNSKAYSYEIDVHKGEVPEENPSENNPPVAVITPSATTISHSGWTTLDAGQSNDPDGTPAEQLNYEWSVTRNADKVELANTSGISTQVRLKAAATSEFDVVVSLKATDPDNNVGETTLVLNAKPVAVTPPVTGDSWDKNKTYATPCQKVTYNGSEWFNGWWTVSNVPGADGEWGVWRKTGDSKMHASCKGMK